MKVLGVLTVSRQPYVHSSFAIVGLFLESAIIWSFVQYQNSIDRWHPMMFFLNCNNFAKALFWWCVYKGPRVLWWWCFFFSLSLLEDGEGKHFYLKCFRCTVILNGFNYFKIWHLIFVWFAMPIYIYQSQNDKGY